MPEILETVLATVVPALALLLAWCVKLLTAFVKSKTEEITSRTKNETLKVYLEVVADNAINVVETLNQTVVEGLKKGSEDGKLTAEDAVSIKNTAVQMLTDTLSADILELLDNVFDDSATYLANVIERTVVKVKENHPVG